MLLVWLRSKAICLLILWHTQSHTHLVPTNVCDVSAFLRHLLNMFELRLDVYSALAIGVNINTIPTHITTQADLFSFPVLSGQTDNVNVKRVAFIYRRSLRSGSHISVFVVLQRIVIQRRFINYYWHLICLNCIWTRWCCVSITLIVCKNKLVQVEWW